MNYELAKKLKDAGFPQKDLYKECPHGVPQTTAMIEHAVNGEGALHPECADGSNAVYRPTLEELIDACGKDGHLFLNLFHECPDGDEGWEAVAEKDAATHAPRRVSGRESVKNYIETSGHGKTPIDAVANLWLKLNE